MRIAEYDVKHGNPKLPFSIVFVSAERTDIAVVFHRDNTHTSLCIAAEYPRRALKGEGAMERPNGKKLKF
jgi:hypothetical protein